MPHLLETKPAVQIGHHGKMVATASTLAIVTAVVPADQEIISNASPTGNKSVVKLATAGQ